MLRGFFSANRRLCHALARFLPQARTHPIVEYERVVARYLCARPHLVVIDAGGGKTCPFAKYNDPVDGAKIISIDVAEEELRGNRDLTETVVANLTQGLPLKAAKADLVVSRTVLEHLDNCDAFVAESWRVLRPGGYTIHVFPSKFAPFAIINQLLPDRLGHKLLDLFQQGSCYFPPGHCGFEHHYHRCYFSAIRSLFETQGFDVVDVQFGYYQSYYFDFFVPFFLLSALYEMLLQAFGARNLCAYILIVARKGGAESEQRTAVADTPGSQDQERREISR